MLQPESPTHSWHSDRTMELKDLTAKPSLRPNMALIFETTGTITDVSEDLCYIELMLFGRTATYIFSSYHIYAFGIPCDGISTDILEIGMTVNVSYTCRTFPEILAVWIGDERDVVNNAMYNKAGRIVDSGYDYFVVQSKNYQTVLVSKDVIFCDGYPLMRDNDKYYPEICINESIMFDAVPLKVEGYGCKQLFVATCAWLGLNEPRVLDRFHHYLYTSARPEDIDGDIVVVGRVAVVVNDNVALVDAPSFNHGKVILLKRQFIPRSESLKDTLFVGAEVLLRLEYGPCSYSDAIWFVSKAWRPSNHDFEKELKTYDGEALVPVEESTSEKSDADLVTASTLTSLENPDARSPTPASTRPLERPVSPVTDPEVILIGEYRRRVPVSFVSEDDGMVGFSGNERVSPLPDSIENKSNPDVPGETFNNEQYMELVCYPKTQTTEETEHDTRIPTVLRANKRDRAAAEEDSRPIDAQNGAPQPKLRKIQSAALDEELNSVDIAEEDQEKYFQQVSVPDFPELQLSNGHVCRGGSFQKSRPSKNNTYILQWPGLIFGDNLIVFEVNNSFSIFKGPCTKLEPLIVQSLTSDRSLESETSVFFDAQHNSLSSNGMILVQKVWSTQGNRPSPDFFTMPNLKYADTAKYNPERIYRGTIIDIPMHDCAIARVEDVKRDVLVNFASLCIDQVYNRNCSTMDMFLTSGDFILLMLTEIKTAEGERYLKSVRCWKELRKHNVRTTYCDKLKRVSWLRTWKNRQTPQKGLVVPRHTGNSWEFVINTGEALVGSAKTKYFKDKYQVTAEVFSSMKEPVNCYVGKGAIGKPFVTYAWVGSPPSASEILKERLWSPRNDLINEARMYEGVVEAFPLPDYVICKINWVPVLCSLKQSNGNIGVVQQSLRRGDIVTITVKQVVFQKEQRHTLVLGTIHTVNEPTGRFVINLRGKIVQAPKPFGLIKPIDGGPEIPFELCCVQYVIPSGCTIYSKSMSKRVHRETQKNREVSFTAKIQPGKQTYACEVWV